MKDRAYRIVVDVWRLAAKYGFRKMGTGEWEGFVSGGNRLVARYRDEGCAAERLCRDLLDAFQKFFRQTQKQNGDER